MESVKVDAQKLQILNERLAQTIEALNQVRLSMHGIGGQPPTTGPVPFTPFGYAYPYAAAPFVPGYGYGYGGPFGPGISHTPWQQTTPWQTMQTMQPWQTMQPPWTQTPWQTMQTPWTQTPQWPTGNGISHTTWETPTWQQHMPRQWTWAW